MMNAGNYGNAAATINNSSNNATGFFLSQVGGFAGKRPTSVYCTFGFNTSPPTFFTTAQRISAAAGAFAGWHGPRPVAFPLTVGWNGLVPLT